MNKNLLSVSLIILFSLIPLRAFAGKCHTDSECKGNRICENGICVYPERNRGPQKCNKDTDCPEEQVCDKGFCADYIPPSAARTPYAPLPAPALPPQPPPPPDEVTPFNTVCEKDDDCGMGRVCMEGVCIVEPEPVVEEEPEPPHEEEEPEKPVPPPVEKEQAADEEPTEEGEGDDIWDWARHGLEIELRGGGNFCMDNGDASCQLSSSEFKSSLDPGGGGGVFAGVRVLPFLSLGFNFGYYTIANNVVDNNSEINTGKGMADMMSVMIDVRGHLPFKPVDVFLALGMGYLSMSRSHYVDQLSFFEYSGSDYEYMDFSYLVEENSWSWFNIELGLGLTYFFYENETFGDIGIGLDSYYVFTMPGGGNYEYCDTGDCIPQCSTTLFNYCFADEKPHSDTVDFIQASLHFSWVIPVF